MTAYQLVTSLLKTMEFNMKHEEYSYIITCFFTSHRYNHINQSYASNQLQSNIMHLFMAILKGCQRTTLAILMKHLLFNMFMGENDETTDIKFGWTP